MFSMGLGVALIGGEGLTGGLFTEAGERFKTARAITDNMYLEAAKAIASLITPANLNRENIIPSVFDGRVVTAVAAAVQHAARQDGVAGE